VFQIKSDVLCWLCRFINFGRLCGVQSRFSETHPVTLTHPESLMCCKNTVLQGRPLSNSSPPACAHDLHPLQLTKWRYAISSWVALNLLWLFFDNFNINWLEFQIKQLTADFLFYAKILLFWFISSFPSRLLAATLFWMHKHKCTWSVITVYMLYVKFPPRRQLRRYSLYPEDGEEGL
jgi:hypothetical protein